MTELVVEKLGMRFEDWLFRDLSFTLKSPDWLTVIGKSGNGKTIMLKALAGLVDLSEGEILLDGKPQNSYAISDYRQNVSYVTQSARLFGQTVRDNLDLPFLIRNLQPDVAKQTAGLLEMDLPSTMLDREISELSGGQKQRIGLLRNLLFPPKVLLLDEISTGLDEETKTAIWHVLRQLHEREQSIILSVTHDSEEIAQAKHCLRIEDGRGVMSNEC